MRKHIVALLALLAWAAAAPAVAADSAVVLMYTRFNDDRFPAASVDLDQFEAHVAELKAGGATVLPLPEIVAALKSGTPLPDRAVAITLDEAGASAYRLAWPRLKAAGLPFTLFVATDGIDRGAEAMSWDQLRELAASPLVTIGSHGSGRARLATLPAEEIAADLRRSRGRFETELGRVPELLAWPLGEASAEAEETAARAGFVAAFGQHSGAVWSRADRYFLPRFSLNQTYGQADRFRLTVGALPLQAIDITPADPRLSTNPPAFGFTLADEKATEGLACYSSVDGRLMLERLGPRVEIRATRPFPSGRIRINCTAPSLDSRWRWFGWQFSVP